MPRTILVEDDPLIADLLQTLFAVEGYQVTQASDGREAFDLLCNEGRRFDLVVLDLMMPRMDGITFMSKVGELRHRPKVLVLSATTSASVRQALLQAGVCTVLRKPIDPEELLSAVQRDIEDCEPAPV